MRDKFNQQMDWDKHLSKKDMRRAEREQLAFLKVRLAGEVHLARERGRGGTEERKRAKGGGVEGQGGQLLRSRIRRKSLLSIDIHALPLSRGRRNLFS